MTVKVTTTPTSGGSELMIELVSTSENYSVKDLYAMSRDTEVMAEAIVTSITDGCETELNKADAIHDYLAQHCEYDNTYSDASYTAYGALVNGMAVCQGYSAAFNVLCEKAGVRAIAVANDEHMWNVVLADGKMYHYDVTFDDGENGILDTYKGVPESVFKPDEKHKSYILPEMQIFDF